VCVVLSWAWRWCVEQAGEFFSHSGIHLFGVLNIAGAAVSPSTIDGTQAV
jgi:hypothetical protein